MAGNNGAECLAPLVHTGERNLADDATCSFSLVGQPAARPAPGQHRRSVARRPTRCRSAARRSTPATPATCLATDQRGAPRPAGACDIGAFEYVLPRLTVTTQVVNDHGRDRATPATSPPTCGRAASTCPAARSPAPPPARRTRSAAGAYAVAPTRRDRLRRSRSAARCAPDGTVALGENEAKTCTIVADDRAPWPAATVNVTTGQRHRPDQAPRPQAVPRADARASRFPVGTTIDTLKGRVELVAAADKQGGTSVRRLLRRHLQARARRKGAKPITTLKLVEKLRCPKAGKRDDRRQEEEEAAAVGRRQRPLPHRGQPQLGDRARHQVAGRGSLHDAR